MEVLMRFSNRHHQISANVEYFFTQQLMYSQIFQNYQCSILPMQLKM
jgi:hypothetical protein